MLKKDSHSLKDQPVDVAMALRNDVTSDSDSWQTQDLFAELDAADSLLNAEDGALPDQPTALADPTTLDQSPNQYPEDDAQSIEAYMAELMKRCQGYSSEPKSVETPSSRSAGIQPAATVPCLAETDKSTSVSTRQAGRQRETAPERQVAMNDLRAVANINSRNHIDACMAQRLVFDMHERLKVSLIAMLISFSVIGFASSTSSLAFLCALLSLIVSIVWSLRFITLSHRLSELCQVLETVESTHDEQAGSTPVA